MTYSSLGVAGALSLLLSIGTYVSLGDETEGNRVSLVAPLRDILLSPIFPLLANVLDSFADDDKAINVARFFFAVTIMLTYPMEQMVCREVVENLFFKNQMGGLTETQHNIITLGTAIVPLIIALSTDNLGVVLELTGVVLASTLAFILPGTFIPGS